MKNTRLSTVVGFLILLYGGYFLVQTARVQTKLSDSTILQSIISIPTLVVVALGIVFGFLEYKYSGSRKAAIALIVAPLLGAVATFLLIL